MTLVDLYVDVERSCPSGRPWVAVNMVASLDGATSVGGRSGGLSSRQDRAVFRALRAAADAVMVGAGTARAEGYGPVRLDDHARRSRVERGLPPVPRLVLVSRRLDLDESLAMFVEAETQSPTTVLAPADADPERLVRLAGVGEVITCGQGSVDLLSGLGELHARGANFVLCEGGPQLNADLARLDCLDEVNLTVAPFLVGGRTPRIFGTVDLVDPVQFVLAHCVAEEGSAFLRYVRSREVNNRG